ncbi:MAG TPA: long-chain fatty acid--CoA ligase [Candidatus Dormibacteraeota bacterium]|nr:long-chain fatty acid--CoA ligase [Candidatus Dormibacteraeota bacterium]
MSIGTSGRTPTTELNPEGIADRTMVGVFYSQAARYGDRPLLHHVVGESWKAQSWADMKRHVLAIASALVDAGVQQGDRVVILSENRFEWVASDFGIQSAGGVTVPIYMGTTPEVIQKIVDNSEAVLAIASNQALAGKLKVGGSLKRIVTMDEDVSVWMARRPQQLATVAARLAAIKPDDLCTILYTSGTTGDPKGVELAHRCLVDIGRAALKVFSLSESDNALSFLPFSHAFERINGVFLFVMFGGEAWISRGADHLAAEIGEVQPTVMNSVPRVYEKMYAAVTAGVRSAPGYRKALFNWARNIGRQYNVEKKRGPLLEVQYRLADRLVLSGLRKRLTGGRLRFFISGGAALSQEIEEFFWSCGIPILNGWGMTELSSGVSSNRLDAHKFLTVGKPFPGVELKIADDGEIMVKGPGNMLGYHKNPEATAETLKDGWIYTGDIGVIDSDGFLKITDRKKALFKTAVGKYIAPQPIEFGLTQDELIDRAVIIGEGRPYIVALIVPDRAAAKKQGLDEAGLREHVQKTLDNVNAHVNGDWETVKYFELLPEDFSEARGELSLKLDVKRKVVAQNYAKEIDSMYAGKSKSGS